MAEEKTPEEIKAEMEKAADEAAKQLKKLPKEAVRVVAEWMKANVAAAGYKKLAKRLVATLPAAPKKAKTEEEG